MQNSEFLNIYISNQTTFHRSVLFFIGIIPFIMAGHESDGLFLWSGGARTSPESLALLFLLPFINNNDGRFQTPAICALAVS